jgi:hypothetical protein
MIPRWKVNSKGKYAYTCVSNKSAPRDSDDYLKLIANFQLKLDLANNVITDYGTLKPEIPKFGLRMYFAEMRIKPYETKEP